VIAGLCAAVTAHDRDRFVSLHEPDAVQEDRRAVLAATVVGLDGAAALFDAVSPAPGTVRAAGEILDTSGELLALARLTFDVASGAGQVEALQVLEATEAGTIARSAILDAGDLASAQALFEAWASPS
jgi:hypothetical protein